MKKVFLRTCNFIRKRLQLKLLRTPLFTDHLRWLLLDYKFLSHLNFFDYTQKISTLKSFLSQEKLYLSTWGTCCFVFSTVWPLYPFYFVVYCLLDFTFPHSIILWSKYSFKTVKCQSTPSLYQSRQRYLSTQWWLLMKTSIL